MTKRKKDKVKVSSKTVNTASKKPKETLVTKKSILDDIEDMLGKMGTVPGVANIKEMINNLREKI
tara:strand:+ start:106 stop:300 length:195 start_codon:yes stop_codon:yes gene_type:complete